MSGTIAKDIIHALHTRIRITWETAFDLSGHNIDEYVQEMTQRHSAWDVISGQGGKPMTILSDAASSLESAGTTPYGDRQKILGFLLDVVSIDDI